MQHRVHPSLLLQVLLQVGGRQIHAQLLQLESDGAAIVQLHAFSFLLQLGLHGRKLHLALRPDSCQLLQVLPVFLLLLLLDRLQLLRQLLDGSLVLAGTLIHAPLLGMHLLPSRVLLEHLLDGRPLLEDQSQFGRVVVAAVFRRVLVRVPGNFLFFFLLSIVNDGSMFKDGALILILTVLFVTLMRQLGVLLARFTLLALAGLQVPRHVLLILFTPAVFAIHLLVVRLPIYSNDISEEQHTQN